MEKLALEKLS
jgi:hypothetical protein